MIGRLAAGMAMASAAAFLPASSSLPPPHPPRHAPLSGICPPLSCSHQPHRRRSKQYLALHALSSAVHSPLNVDYLVREFAGHGVGFEGIGDDCVVKLGLDNGSVAKLLLPSGLITSYKPSMWHGTTLEVLHTTVSEGGGGGGGGAVIRGGVSMDFKCRSDGGASSWSPTIWALRDVRGSSENSIQVELVSISPENTVEARCVVTLHPDLLSSELTVSNTKSPPLLLSGSVVNHLTVSTPDATFAVGLQGSCYRGRKPMDSEFCIIPPELTSKRSSPTTSQPWAQRALEGLLSGWETGEDKAEGGAAGGGSFADVSEGEEGEDYAHMTDEMCRTYTSAPREFTVIDRGRRNSVAVGRSGFDDLYILSPGSNHEWYGKYAFICVGHSVQAPVALGPGGVWKGAQYLRNPNL